MKKLAFVTEPPNYIEHFKSIRDNKHLATRNALIAKHTTISNRFADYENRFNNDTLQGMTPTRLGSVRTELRSCYGRNVGMNALKNMIKDAQPKGRLLWCPYCGATTPGSHDHYLPAEKFPEFAAHALNIVPCCTRCNSIKDDDWLAAGARQYLHFYRDAIPAVPFLTATIVSKTDIQAVGVNFSVQQAGMPTASWRLIESHFHRLQLVELYDYYANDLINTILRSARSHIEDGGASAANFIAREATENSDLYGEYGWRAVLHREMSTHPDLDQWITWL